MTVVDRSGCVGEAAARQALAEFRVAYYQCLRKRADAMFELCDTVLCSPGPVTSLPELTMDSVHRRGHGAMYDALAAGEIDLISLRMSLATLALPRSSQGQLRLAVDVTPWPRPDAECSPQRCHCHRPCRCDGVRQTIPGWPYSIVAALESGPLVVDRAAGRDTATSRRRRSPRSPPPRSVT